MKYPDTESSTLEFKRTVPENDQILKTIIGFCNRNGGRLILGVDADRSIVGIPEEKIQQLMEYLNKSIFESTSPPIIPAVYSQRVGDKTLLIIEVPSGMNKPYYKTSEKLDKGVYIRLGRSTVRATADIIDELKWQSRGRSFDMMPIYHSTDKDLDEKKIVEFLDSRKLFHVSTINPTLLASYHLLVEEYSLLYPSIGGMLLFGKNPQSYFSEAIIICSHFSGTSGQEVLATIDCTGTLFEQFHTAYNFIIQRLSRSFTIQQPKRTEDLEIPEIAIREVLLNALVHRNYNIKAPIKIAIYDNRLEFFSPGVFPGPLNTSNLKLGITYIRNTVISKVFREAGYIEKLGSGFITLFDSYEQKKLHPPEVIECENYIKCILPRTSFASYPVTQKDELQKILSLFEVSEEIAISDVISKLCISRPTAGRKLNELAKQGFIEKVGEGRVTRYRTIKKIK